MTMDLRFGIHYLTQTADIPTYAEVCNTTEDLGLDWLSVHDGMRSNQGPDAPSLEGLTMLAAIASMTKRVRCGILVAGVTYRHPAMLAKVATTLDHLSGGRLELGVGASGFALEHERLGIDFPSTGARFDMLEESLDILRGLWTNPLTTFSGQHFTLHEAIAEPKPVQTRLPVWIGGGGEQRTLRLVAERADGWNFVLVEEDAYRHKLGVLDRHCHELGRDPREIRKQVLVDAVLGRNEADWGSRTPPAKIAEKNLNTRPRVPCLIGTPRQLVDQLIPYVDLGVQDFILLAQPPTDMRTIELFAQEVAPELRDYSRV